MAQVSRLKKIQIGKKIMVIGCPGSGKSTFSRRLSELTGLPLIHLDKEFWNAGWVETPRDEWKQKQESLLAGNTWIVDGNFGGTMDIRIDKADTIILFNLSRLVCLTSYFKRIITHLGKVRADMPDGCPEKLDIKFIRYIWRFPELSGQRNNDRINSCSDKIVIVFHTRREALSLLRGLGKIG